MKYLDKTSAIGENTADNRFDSSNVVSNRDGSVLERTEYLIQSANPLADFILIDKDVFDVADADANNERWNVGYITGTEGGSADINTTTSGKLMVGVDPDATPTEARYAVNKALAVMGDVWKVTADLNLTWGTMGVTGCAAGIILSKTTTYDSTNYFHFERAKTSTTDRLTLSGKLNNVAISAVTPITLADNAVALKIERWGEIYRFYYSTAQNPDESWTLFTEVEDASNYMTNQVGIFLESYSKGSADAESVIANFDTFQLFAGAGGGLIELAGDYDSTWTTASHDGNVFERLEGVESDLKIIDSNLSDVQSDVIIIQSDVKTVQSNLTVAKSDIVTVLSNITSFRSDIIATTDSDIVVIQSDLKIVKSNLSDVQSDLIVTQSDVKTVLSNIVSFRSDIIATTDSDIVVIQSDLKIVRSNLSDVQSDVIIIQSDLKALASNIIADTNSDIVVVQSDLKLVKSNLSDVQSDVTIILSDLKVLDAASDSDMIVLKSDIVVVQSDLKIVKSNLSDVQSDVIIIQSDLKALASNIVADTNSDIVVIQSDLKINETAHLTRKTITYTGAASYAAFTVTGCVACKCIGYVTTALSNSADTTSVGTATSAAGLIAATAGTAMQTIGQVWVDTAPSKFEPFPTSMSAIGNGEDVAVVGTVNLAVGVVELYLFWVALSSDGAVVAA